MDREPAAMPEWLLARLVAKPKPVPASRSSDDGKRIALGTTDDGQFWLERAVAYARPGQRNAMGHWLACQLRDSARFSESQAEPIMLAYSCTFASTMRMPGQSFRASHTAVPVFTPHAFAS